MQINIGRVAIDTISFQPISVSSGMFGAIFISQRSTTINAIEELKDRMNLGYLRWPGGTLSETGTTDGTGPVDLHGVPGDPVAYSLNYPTLFHPDLVAGNPEGERWPGLSEMLSLAGTTGSAISIILPTVRYEALPERAERDVLSFLVALGSAVRNMDGLRPKEIILDIGNENYDSVPYGRVAARMLDAVKSYREGNGELSFKVALQVMQSGSETRNLVQVLERNSEHADIFSEVDIIRAHDLGHTAQQISQIEATGPKLWALRAMYSAVLEANRTKFGERIGPEISFSAWTTLNQSNGGGDQFTFKSSHTMLSLFTGMLELGADYSAAWGFGTSAGVPTAMSWFDASQGTYDYSPSAIMFSRLSRRVPGFELVQSDYMDSDPEQDIAVFVFKKDSRVVIYAVNFGAVSPGFQNTIELKDAVRVKPVSMWALNDGMDRFQVSTDDDRLKSDMGKITFSFSSEMEVVEIVLEVAAIDRITGNNVGSRQNERMYGTASADTISGRAGFDELIGRSGRDHLSGGYGEDNLWGGLGGDFIKGGVGGDFISAGSGHDTVFGGSGNDTMQGGGGDDRIWGGNKSDIIVGGSGDDTLHGSFGSDTLIGSAGNDVLFGGASGDVFVFSGVFGRDHVMDFSPGEDSLRILGVDHSNIRIMNSRGGTTVSIPEMGQILLEGVHASDWLNLF